MCTHLHALFQLLPVAVWQISVAVAAEVRGSPGTPCRSIRGNRKGFYPLLLYIPILRSRRNMQSAGKMRGRRAAAVRDTTDVADRAKGKGRIKGGRRTTRDHRCGVRERG